MTELVLSLPKKIKALPIEERTVIMVTNGDLREAANLKCWPVQQKFEQKLREVIERRFGYCLVRGHDIDLNRGHGFIAGQREGSDVLAAIDPDAAVIVLLTTWQYSHHLASGLARHRGSILLLANFDGTWPGLVGQLCLAGTLTALGVPYSRLWSENFDDDFFLDGLETWLREGKIIHDTSYLKEITKDHEISKTPAARTGRQVGEYILQHQEIIGLCDSFCMGMINGVFPLEMMVRIGMPIESLSQSALFYEMSRIPKRLREACLAWYEKQGMHFIYVSHPG